MRELCGACKRIHTVNPKCQLCKSKPSTLALVSCGKTKLDRTAEAQDLYTGDLFKKARANAERNHDEWAILSALYYMVNPSDYLGPYECTLIGQPKSVIMGWSAYVFAQIKDKYTTNTEIFIYAGAEYRKFLVPMLENAGYTVKVPLQGLGIGQQLAWYKQKAAE